MNYANCPGTNEYAQATAGDPRPQGEYDPSQQEHDIFRASDGATASHAEKATYAHIAIANVLAKRRVRWDITYDDRYGAPVWVDCPHTPDSVEVHDPNYPEVCWLYRLTGEKWQTALGFPRQYKCEGEL